MKSIHYPLLCAAAVAALFSSCQSKKGQDTADMVALDYPFDEHGNYIESKAQKKSAVKEDKPTTLAMTDVPPPPAPVKPSGGGNYAPLPDVVPPPPPTLADSTPPRPPGGTGGGSTSVTKKTGGTTKSATGKSGTSVAGKSYTVERGDTLSEIAAKAGTTVAAIRKANGLSNTNMIRVGQKLKMPGGSKTIAQKSQKSGSGKAASSGGGSYTVKSGDSLWVIARKNNTTVDKIKRANNLSGDALKPGQKLTIP